MYYTNLSLVFHCVQNKYTGTMCDGFLPQNPNRVWTGSFQEFGQKETKESKLSHSYSSAPSIDLLLRAKLDNSPVQNGVSCGGLLSICTRVTYDPTLCFLEVVDVITCQQELIYLNATASNPELTIFGVLTHKPNFANHSIWMFGSASSLSCAWKLRKPSFVYCQQLICPSCSVLPCTNGNAGSQHCSLAVACFHLLAFLAALNSPGSCSKSA